MGQEEGEKKLNAGNPTVDEILKLRIKWADSDTSHNILSRFTYQKMCGKW